VEIKGDKVILRDWKVSDFEYYRYWMSPEHEWHKFDGPYYPRTTKEEVEESIEKLSNQITNNNFEIPRRSLIVTSTNSDQLIGRVNCYWESKETKWLCIGIGIYDDSLWGTGLGADALKIWINYLFSAHEDIVRLDLRTWSGNIGMIKLAQKLGFKQEACFRKARIVDGKYYDSLVYGILREEWNKRVNDV